MVGVSAKDAWDSIQSPIQQLRQLIAMYIPCQLGGDICCHASMTYAPNLQQTAFVRAAQCCPCRNRNWTWQQKLQLLIGKNIQMAQWESGLPPLLKQILVKPIPEKNKTKSIHSFPQQKRMAQITMKRNTVMENLASLFFGYYPLLFNGILQVLHRFNSVIVIVVTYLTSPNCSIAPCIIL